MHHYYMKLVNPLHQLLQTELIHLKKGGTGHEEKTRPFDLVNFGHLARGCGIGDCLRSEHGCLRARADVHDPCRGGTAQYCGNFHKRKKIARKIVMTKVVTSL